MKKILYGAVVVVLAAILVAVIWLTRSGGSRIAEGTYRIRNCEKYPDAYIVVKEDTIQLFNFDLNAEYRDDIYSSAMKMKEKKFDQVKNLSDEELYELCDLNSLFVDVPYRMTKEYTTINQKGTFEYGYYFFGGFTVNHVLYDYDSFHGTLKLNSEYEFKR